MRPETQKVYREASTYLEELLIALYIYHGWDDIWPYTDMPKWLKPRYGMETE